MGKLFILLGIHVKNKEKGAEKTLKGGGGGEVTMTHQLQKSTPTWARISSDRNEFCTLRGGGTTADSNAPGSFLVSPPSGRGLVIPVFFWVVNLPQTFARSKQYLPVIFVRLEFIRQNFHDSWCRKLLAI